MIGSEPRGWRVWTYHLVVVLALLLAATDSSAGSPGWPKPAGGASASGGPEIILTFDDGPHREYTATILDELKRRGLQAIFFWVGHRVTKGGHTNQQIELVHRAVREGHLIANHTINHANLCLVKPAEAELEIDENTRIYEELSGLPILLFRSPYGARCRRLMKILDERSLAHLHWDIDPREWMHHDSDEVTRYVIAKLKHLDGRAVVLMHDTKAASARALPRILDWIDKENERRRKRGDKPPIRILSGSDLMVERLDPAVPDWFAGAVDRSMLTITSTLGRLLP